MRTVGAYEAKVHLAELLDRAQEGETIIITRHGMPVARLVPAESRSFASPGDAIDALIAYRKKLRLRGLSIRKLIEEGRK